MHWKSLSAFFCLAAAAASGQGRIVVDDPLTDGRTVGVRDNGQGEFVAGGFLLTGSSDNIRYTPAAPIEEGAIEFDVSGLRFDDTRPENHRGQLLSMYDASFGDPRHVYTPDLRKNPFKFVLHRYGYDEEGYFANHLKFIMNTDGVNQFEDYSSVGAFPWDEGRTYRMRLEWRDGVIRFFIDGQDVDRWPFVYRSVYRPAIHDIRIGTNTRDNAIVGAVYSNVKIYDFGTTPAPPRIDQPRSVAHDLSPVIGWTGNGHTHYEVRVTSTPDPETGVLWSSGAVPSSASYAVSDTLSDRTAYFAHVRLRNDRGWGTWSEPHPFEMREGEPPVVPAYSEHEILLLSSRRPSNPYTDVWVQATLDGPSQSFTTNGFWDGGGLYKVRVLPTEAGSWSWTVRSNDPELDGRRGTFLSEASSSGGYVRVSPDRPYTFEWVGTGEPFFLLGDTIWHMFYHLRFSDGSFQTLIDARAAQHFNYAHGVVHDFLANEGGPIYLGQDELREMHDTDTLNPDYFRVIDEKIDYMNGRGMVAGLFFSWGNEGYQEYETPEQYERYLRYLVARYASKNVFWILVGEYEEAGEPRSRWRDYASVVAESDPYGHPISIHTVETTDAFGPDPEHSFVSHQRKGSPEELRALVAQSRVFEKPVVNLEYGYEGDPQVFRSNQPPDDVRRDHYALALAGGYGVYGNHTPWYSTYHRVGDFVLEATDTPGAEYLKVLYRFFASTQFHRLSPAQELVDRGIAAAWPGNEYVVELPQGGSVRLDLRATPRGFVADWFDPRNGERRSLGRVSGGKTISFVAPTDDDWVLHLYNYPPRGSGGARIDLGSVNLEEGLFLVETSDGGTTAVSVGGRDARASAIPGEDLYFYFDVSDAFHFEEAHSETLVTIQYFDAGTGALVLQYDAAGGERYRHGGSVALEGAGTWKAHTFRLTDAFFGNRQNGGADFRVFTGGTSAALDVVEISHGTPGPPGEASSPSPAHEARDVALDVVLGWTPGTSARFHDVYFGAAGALEYRGRRTEAVFAPGPLAPATTYFWRIDEGNERGTTPGILWSFTTGEFAGAPTVRVLPANGIHVDGRSDEWNLDDFQSVVRAGDVHTGDFALVGYEGGALHVSGYATHLSLPDSPSDHTARVYSRHDAESLYFLVRVDDDDLRAPHPVEMNWANDAVEIYIDPSADGGFTPMAQSTSDVQLVVDAANRANAYMTTAAYRERVLDGVASAVTVDERGWWLEVQIRKSALAPSLPAAGELGLDFNFRDNDFDNAPERTTVYTWSDFERSATFPSKIPDRWGRGRLLSLGPSVRPTAPAEPQPSNGARDVSVDTRPSFGGGLGASSYDVFFGESNPPPLVSRQLAKVYDPGTLEPDTAYYWRVDAVNGAGTTAGPLWSFSTGADVSKPTLRVHPAGAIVVDGDPSDWQLEELSELVRAGDVVEGDAALVGYDGAALYFSGRFTGASLPESVFDHTARAYARHDASRLYFLVWVSDDEIQTAHGSESNWANDSVEIYIDPGGDGGESPLDGSSSDVQLVIDAANRRNVYVTTDGYRAQVLSGVASAVSRHPSGWWCEVSIEKEVLDPDLASTGSLGLDFNFRDNDGNNDPSRTTVYTWADSEQSGRFPSKIPNRWGRAKLIEPQ